MDNFDFAKYKNIINNLLLTGFKERSTREFEFLFKYGGKSNRSRGLKSVEDLEKKIPLFGFYQNEEDYYMFSLIKEIYLITGDYIFEDVEFPISIETYKECLEVRNCGALEFLEFQSNLEWVRQFDKENYKKYLDRLNQTILLFEPLNSEELLRYIDECRENLLEFKDVYELIKEREIMRATDKQEVFEKINQDIYNFNSDLYNHEIERVRKEVYNTENYIDSLEIEYLQHLDNGLKLIIFFDERKKVLEFSTSTNVLNYITKKIKILQFKYLKILDVNAEVIEDVKIYLAREFLVANRISKQKSNRFVVVSKAKKYLISEYGIGNKFNKYIKDFGMELITISSSSQLVDIIEFITNLNDLRSNYLN
ncbi:hypothetical protein RyT2_00370 [Pseudolactococcus yaeyamensis]